MVPNPFKHCDVRADTSATASPQNASLTSILSSAQRAELLLLLHACTACMRRSITDVFDPRVSAVARDGQDVRPGKGEEREEAEARIKELERPEMQELKRGALAFFDRWLESVQGRVGEVLNKRAEGRGEGKVEREAKGEAKGEIEEAAKEKMVSAESGMPEAEEVEKQAHAPKSEDKKLSEDDIKVADTSSAAQTATVNETVKHIYSPIPTPLKTDLDLERRKLLLHSVMLLLLSLEHYTAHSRILLLYLASSLDLPTAWLSEVEATIASGLLKAAEDMNADEETEKKARENATSRKWKVGLASVAGAAVIGITGGLAAPLVAAGLGTVMGGLGLAETAAAVYLGTVASSTVVVGGLFGAYGGRMTGKMMDEYAKEVEDFGFVPVHKWSRPHKIAEEKEYRRLRVAIGVSGWLTDKEDVIKPWRVLGPGIEGFALKYEMESLLRLGNAITSLLKSTAWSYAKKELIKRTIFMALKEALWPLALLRVSRIVDNPFSVAKARSDKAGEVLADALINKAQGERPVSLIGYSLGARVIYTCLLSLADRGAFGLIENVVLLGTPAPSDSAPWRKIRSVVSGRLVNVHSENDYILGFLYRASAAQYGVAGLNEAEFVSGVENVDVSDIVTGHLRYRYVTGAILKRIGFEDVDVEEVAMEEDELAAVEADERPLDRDPRADVSDEKEAEKEAERLEKEVQRKNEVGMMDWASAKLSLTGEKARQFWGSVSGSEERRRKYEEKEAKLPPGLRDDPDKKKKAGEWSGHAGDVLVGVGPL